MSGDTYIARAAALQVAAAIDKGGHFFCDQLPSMDVEEFLTALGEETCDGASVSLALVGYGVSETDLRYRLNALGLAVGHVTTDLHVAARWRNEPEAHSQIIALATGRHPGVSTLAHFPQGDTREFARSLLRWARTEEAGLASTLPQRTLLQVLEEKSELSPLVSLSGVAAFLATWQEARSDDELGAPRRALPRLGVLPDRNLLSQSDNVAERLLRNFKLQLFDPAVPRIPLPPGCIRVIGLPRRAHTEGIGSEAPHLQSDPRLSCRDPRNKYVDSTLSKGAILVIEVRLQHPEMLVAGVPPEVLLRLTERRRRPPHRHLSIPPAADAPRMLTNAGVRRVDDVRRRQAPTERQRQPDAVDREQLGKPFAQAGRRRRPFPRQPGAAQVSPRSRGLGRHLRHSAGAVRRAECLDHRTLASAPHRASVNTATDAGVHRSAKRLEFSRPLSDTIQLGQLVARSLAGRRPVT